MRGGDLTDFCLVLTPNRSAATRASEAIQKRFAFIAEETRTNLAAVVTELVQKRVERGTGKPITVAIALEEKLIHGEVSDQGYSNPAAAAVQGHGGPSNGPSVLDRLTSRWATHEGTTDVWFEVPLVRPAV